MTEEDVRQLLKKYNDNQASPEEMALVENWFHAQIKNQDFEVKELDIYRLKIEIRKAIQKNSKLTKDRTHYAIAAVLLFLIAIGSYLYLNSERKTFNGNPAQLSKRFDIKSGGNKATLTLADGRVIELDRHKNGLVMHGDSVTYADGAEIASNEFVFKTGKTSETEGFNTITTPRGGQYHIVLPDGSKVWLNAASILSYPRHFDPNERKVKLIGEAYFEIAKVTLPNHSAKPFIVQSPKQEVEVLGTHFNINAYEDDARVITTLLEGSVRVHVPNENKALKLVPGQQSIIRTGENATITTADLNEATGWKNGEFIFYNKSIRMVMNDIARWYDVDIVYKDSVQDKLIWGSVSKFENISTVLKMIELTGLVHFEIQMRGDDRRVYVMN